MPNDFYNGEDTQLATENIGEDTQLATGTDEEGLGEDTQLEPEEETEISLADLLDESDEDKNAESEGLDSPPNQNKPEGEKQAEKPADYYRSQAEVDAVVQKRLKQARAQWDKEQAAKIPQGKTLEQLLDADIEREARNLLEKNPEMKMTLDVAKMIVKGQQPVVQPVQEQQTEPEDERQQKVEAWKQSLIDEEPMLRVQLNNPDITVAEYAKQNPAFEAALRVGNTPMQAYHVAKALEPHMQKRETDAKVTAQKDLINRMKTSNARAATPVNAKGGVKKTSSADRISSMSDEEFDNLNRHLAETGSIYVGD